MQKNFITLDGAVDEVRNIENELVRTQTVHQSRKPVKSGTRNKSPEKARVQFVHSNDNSELKVL